MFPRDRAVRDARTTESRLRDSRTESGGEWPGNRLYGVSEKCIRHKPRERGENSTPREKNSYVISNTQFVAERGGFEPEVSLGVLPTAQAETPAPTPNSLWPILVVRVGHALPQTPKPFRIAELPASIRSPPLVANA